MLRSLGRARPKPQLLILFLFAVTYCINILNSVLYISLLPDVSDSVKSAYLIFSIVGFVVFYLIASPLIYWPYARGKEMSPKTRRNVASIGIIICFFIHDFPLEWLEIYLVWNHGWSNIFSGISLFLVSFTFAVGFFTTWISYTWTISKRLQLYYSETLTMIPPSSGYMPASIN